MNTSTSFSRLFRHLSLVLLSMLAPGLQLVNAGIETDIGTVYHLGSLGEPFDAVERIKEIAEKCNRETQPDWDFPGLLAGSSRRNAFTYERFFRNFRQKRTHRKMYQEEANAVCKALEPQYTLDLTEEVPFAVKDSTNEEEVYTRDSSNQIFKLKATQLYDRWGFRDLSEANLDRFNRNLSLGAAFSTFLFAGGLVAAGVLMPPLIPVAFIGGILVAPVTALGLPHLIYTRLLSPPQALRLHPDDLMQVPVQSRNHQNESPIPNRIFTTIKCAPNRNLSSFQIMTSRLKKKVIRTASALHQKLHRKSSVRAN